MEAKKSKSGLILSSIYITLVFFSFIVILIASLHANIKQPDFAAVYLILLTLPWSAIAIYFFDYLGILDSIPSLIFFLLFILFASINGFIIYYIGSKFGTSKD